MIDPIDSLLNDPLNSDLSSGELGQLRDLRQNMQAAESDLSLVRRLTQGRLDIVGHEVSGRESGIPQPVDTSAVLFELPEILSEQAAGSRGGRVDVSEPGEVAHQLIGALDSLISPAQLAGVSDLAESDVQAMFGALQEFESDLSGVRKDLHSSIDNIQREIGQRYVNGVATTEDAFKA